MSSSRSQAWASGAIGDEDFFPLIEQLRGRLAAIDRDRQARQPLVVHGQAVSGMTLRVAWPQLLEMIGYREDELSGMQERWTAIVHPADTARHQGLHGYEWAFDQRLPATRITVHLVDEGLDTGRVLAQREVDLRGAETLAEVERRGLAVEHQLYPEALKTFLALSFPPLNPEP